MTSNGTATRPEHPIISHLYAEVDSANHRLEQIGSRYRVWKNIMVYDVTVKSPVNTTDQNGHPPVVQADVTSCRLCGELIPVGGCHPCPNCGEMNGGCA